jgi:outer membrane protein
MRLSSRVLQLIALVAPLAFCQPATALDLIQSYREALANDSTFAAARYANIAGQERLPQARANLLPYVGAALGRTRAETDSGPYHETTTSTDVSLQLTQPLFDWSIWQGYEQSKLLVAISDAQLVQARQDLALRVSQAYFDVLAAQDDLTFIASQKSAISEQLASAKRNFEIGSATITDTYEAQARYDLVIATELQAESALDLARSALRQVIGTSPGQLATLRADVEVPAPQPARVDDWIGQAVTQNLQVVQSQLSTEVAARSIEIAKAGHLPTVALTASLGRNLLGDAQTQSGVLLPRGTTTRAIGVQLLVPVFSGYATSSRITESVALREKALFDLETARRNVSQSTRLAYLGVTSGLAQIQALKAAEISSRSALDANKLGYEVGVRINIDVLNAQQQLFSTQRDLARARYDALNFSLQLKSAIGVLGEADVEAINRLLMP